jgi:hypothetical protein
MVTGHYRVKGRVFYNTSADYVRVAYNKFN